QKLKKQLQPLIWRWHLFAGLILAPFLIIIAVTGAIYLFRADIEEYIYKDYYYVEAEGEQLPPSDLAFTALNTVTGGEDITRYRPGESDTRSVEVGITDEDGESLTAFVNPYTREVLGIINDSTRPHEGDGAYTAELNIPREGLYLIKAHVKDDTIDALPTKYFTVGSLDMFEEVFIQEFSNDDSMQTHSHH